MANEKRPIDANALWDNINSSPASAATKVTARAFVDTTPTMDAVEVVHGRWIFKHDPITDPEKYFIRIVCSECNLHTGQKSNYCPNCGAKMDGDGNA